MNAEQINSVYAWEQNFTVEGSVGKNVKAKRDLNYNVSEESIISTTRARKNSASKYIVARKASESLTDTPVVQNGSTANNAAFVGLNRRRKISLPTRLPTKPGQFREGGRIELAKREVDLDACMPVFTEAEATGSSQQHSSQAPLAKTDFNGWMFEEARSSDSARQAHSARRRRISLPVLKVDHTDTQGYPNNDCVPSNQSGYLSPTWSAKSTSIPQVQSGPLISKKSDTRQCKSDTRQCKSDTRQ